MDYPALLRRAWELTWKHKILWVFGLFTSCSSQNLQFNFSGSPNSVSYEFGQGDVDQISRFLQQYGRELAAGAAVFFLCMCILVLAFWVIGALAQGSLIAGFSMAHEGTVVTFNSAWEQGVRFFGRILVINLIPLGLVLLTMVLLVISLGICIFPLICLAIPIALAVTVLVKLSATAVVVEDLSVGEAVERAWQIMQTQLAELLVIGLLLVVVGFIASLLIGAPFLLTAAPFLIGMLIGSQEALATGAGLLIGCGALYIPVMILLNAVLNTFTNGAWTLAYRRWAGIDQTL